MFSAYAISAPNGKFKYPNDNTEYSASDAPLPSSRDVKARDHLQEVFFHATRGPNLFCSYQFPNFNRAPPTLEYIYLISTHTRVLCVHRERGRGLGTKGAELGSRVRRAIGTGRCAGHVGSLSRHEGLAHVALFRASSIYSTLVPLVDSSNHLVHSYVASIRTVVQNCHVSFGNCRHRRQSIRIGRNMMQCANESSLLLRTACVASSGRAIHNIASQSRPPKNSRNIFKSFIIGKIVLHTSSRLINTEKTRILN